MGWIYDGMGQLVRALACYKQALWIHREVGDRAGEAVTLSNMGHIYLQQDEPERSVGMLTEAMQIAADVGAVAQEASYCYNLVVVLNYLGRGEKAAMLLRHSIMLLERAELSQDAAGATLEMHRALLHQVEAGEPETDLGEGGDEVMAAIQAYVGAEDWEVTCQVVEERQADLYRPEVEGIIWDNIIAARKSGDEEWAALLETHLRLLWACKAEGIGAAFARLTQRRE
jgi:tetratricopeptide (TPR) repeat protein